MADRLPPDLLRFIGFKLDRTGDRIRFRAVSKSWRSALPFRQPPLLMLSESRNGNEPGVFISLGDETICKIVDFPDFREARVVGCAGCWLVTMHLDKTIRLSNPFSKLQFQLPFNHNVLPNISPLNFIHHFVGKIALSSPPRSGGDRDCIAMTTEWGNVNLAIARPGDASWTAVVDYPNMNCLYFEDVIFYEQQFYAISSRGKLAVCNIGDNLMPPQSSVLLDCFIDKMSCGRRHYLVERSRELLMVVRFLDPDFSDEDRLRTNTFKIYKLDLTNMKFDEFKCLGDHSLFLGLNTSVSVLASSYFGLVRRNCIYFTDDKVCTSFAVDRIYARRQTENDIGVFDLEDNTITPLFKGASTPVYFGVPRSVWIIPA